MYAHITLQVPEEVTEVEGVVASGDLPSEPAQCDAATPPSQKEGKQEGRGGGGGGGGITEQDGTPSMDDTEDCAAVPSSPVVAPAPSVSSPPAHTKAPSKRPSPSQTEEGREGVESCKRAKPEECERAEEGECCD